MESGRWQAVLKENNVPGLDDDLSFRVPNPIAAFVVLVSLCRQASSTVL